MQCRYLPRPPLSQFIEAFWIFEGYRPQHDKERLLPDGSTSVVFSLREDPYCVYGKRGTQCGTFRGGSVSGPQSDFFVLDADAQEAVIGVHFKPGGAFPFFPLPLDELNNLHIPARDIWGISAEHVAGDLIRAERPARRFQILEQFLIRQMGTAAEQHPMVGYALRRFTQKPSSTVAEVADEAGWSKRRFIEAFRTEAGLTPKLFCRLQRFQKMLRSIATGTIVNWADAALDCGYFDQAHLIHEFQEFAGLSPVAYVKAKPRFLNHVPLLD
jgi:AraC-like DNA-binding protein